RRRRDGRAGRGTAPPRLRPVPFLHVESVRPHLCRMPSVGYAGERHAMSFDRASRIQWMIEEAKKRVLLLDGSWGVMMQGYKLGEDDYRGKRFAGHNSELKGNNDLLTLTRPDIVREIGHAYLAAGADIIETNTFTSTETSQAA